MNKALLVVPIALAAASLAWPRTYASPTNHNPLDGTWQLVSGQPLPKGARDVKIISGGHFIFVAYDADTGKPFYTGGGTYTLSGSSYTEHMDFAGEQISALIGKEQSFTVDVSGDTFTQRGTLSNGKPLAELWKRLR